MRPYISLGLCLIGGNKARATMTKIYDLITERDQERRVDMGECNIKVNALTLHQPWASLIAHGVKTIETRSWSPPRSAIGRLLAIHAGKQVARPESLHADTLAAIVELYGESWRTEIPRGAVVAVVRLAGAYQVDEDSGDNVLVMVAPYSSRKFVKVDPHGDFEVGRWLWMLEEVRPHELVPAIGHQGLWRWEAPQGLVGEWNPCARIATSAGRPTAGTR